MASRKLTAKLTKALRALSEWLETEQIPYVSIGGIAVALVARPRATRDIDSVIWLDSSRWQNFLRTGEQFEIVPRISNPLEFAQRSRVLLLMHQPTGVEIDLSCGALPFEEEMIERAVKIKVGPLALKVATPEDLIITKAVASRPQDLADIDTIIKTVETVDRERILYWVTQFAEVLEMPEILENVERLLQAQ